MWSSTLPTRTVRNEGRSRRTFPRQSTAQPNSRRKQPQQPDSTANRSQAALREEVDRLRTENQQAEAEIQRLQSEIDRLRGQLADHQQSQQAIIDRYEAILGELESAAATDPPAATRRAPVDSAGSTESRRAEKGVIARLRRWLLG
ncbi:MAG: hypothetical protein U9O06_11850 [Euryarchaeota archaeon]|nr:hypothetical protein [Euryarchaeota archaeon]